MEREISLKLSGWFIVLLQLGLGAFSAWWLTHYWSLSGGDLGVGEVEHGYVWLWTVPSLSVVIALILFGSYTIIAPNEAVVLEFMGKYKGTIKANGFVAKNPFWGGVMVSLKVGSWESAVIKVNDKDGVPIEISAVMTYKTKDTYQSTYGSDQVAEYIKNQAILCLREFAKRHTYNELTTNEGEFATDLEKALEKVGEQVLSAKIATLNFAPEISAAMLQKQQANAMSEARQTILRNAIEMANDAKDHLTFGGDTMLKAKFVANLILILCSERPATNIIDVTN